MTKSGGFTETRYDNALTDAAQIACRSNDVFGAIGPGYHQVGDFDSVWFVRDGIPSITIASYNRHGLMPAIHTPDDTADKVNIKQVEKAARFAEALVRMTPGQGK